MRGAALIVRQDHVAIRARIVVRRRVVTAGHWIERYLELGVTESVFRPDSAR